MVRLPLKRQPTVLPNPDFMKAKSIRYTPEGKIELLDTDVPAPDDLEVQLKGHYCGICSWDISTCRLGREMPAPAPPGHEGITEVVAVGSKVRGVAVGDFYAHGGFQTLANHPVSDLEGKRLPAGIRPGPEWLAEPVSCCVTAMDTSPLKAGDHVVVIGCGFMGQIIIQLLATSFAARVYALDTNPDRLRLASDKGRVECFQLEPENTMAIEERLKELPVDIVYDTTGAQEGLDLATRIIRLGGHINLFGWLKGNTATFNPSLWHMNGIQVTNSSPSGKIRDPFPPAIRLMETGLVNLKPLISHIVPLEEYPGLMQSVVDGNPDYLKGVIALQ